MEKNAHFECIEYIPPKADIIHVNYQTILCQSGEVPDMREGWELDL